MIRRSRLVDPDRQRVVKLSPDVPPRKGERILVDDVACRVVRSRVRWDGAHWTILELRVRDDE